MEYLYLAIYLIGCIVSYYILAVHNDRNPYDKINGFLVIFSWITLLAYIIGMGLEYISKLNHYPTLKWFKRKTN